MTQSLPHVRGAISSEKHVKAKIKQLLDRFGWFWWMVPANGYGTTGVSDFNAMKSGVFLAVEAKFGRNKPSPMQKGWAGSIVAEQGFAFCVNETLLEALEHFLESFEHSILAERAGEKVDPSHGARMMNAMSALTGLYAQV